jgi:hypothetical protein
MRGNQKNNNYTFQWSPEVAYAIGLITTDGSLSKDGRHIIFVSKDIQLIKTFKSCLGLDSKIGKTISGYTGKKNTCKVQFSHIKLYKTLLDIGLYPNKTKTIKGVKIPEVYFPDFLRGHFDGDGSFYSYFDKRWKDSFMYYLTFISASSQHIFWLQNSICELFNCKGAVNTSKGITQLRYAKKETGILLNKMYYSSSVPCLKRKFYKIQFILDNKPR